MKLKADIVCFYKVIRYLHHDNIIKIQKQYTQMTMVSSTSNIIKESEKTIRKNSTVGTVLMKLVINKKCIPNCWGKSVHSQSYSEISIAYIRYSNLVTHKTCYEPGSQCKPAVIHIHIILFMKCTGAYQIFLFSSCLLYFCIVCMHAYKRLGY